jgi:hypothetical protein
MPKGYALSEATKEGIWELRAQGLSERGRSPASWDSARTRSASTCEPSGGTRPRPRRRAERCLTTDEREEISRGIARGCSARAIARELGRSHTTIVREINRCGGRTRYRATQQTARPGGGRDGRGRRSSSSVPSFAGWSKSDFAMTTRPSRSPAGFVLPTPTMRQCRSPTRPSTGRSTFRGEAHSNASSPAI